MNREIVILENVQSVFRLFERKALSRDILEAPHATDVFVYSVKEKTKQIVLVLPELRAHPNIPTNFSNR